MQRSLPRRRGGSGPIIINSLTAIGGALPVAAGLGTGAALQAPLAIALIGGLVTSTVLSPAAVSVMYSAFEAARAPRRSRRSSEARPPGRRARRGRRVAPGRAAESTS